MVRARRDQRQTLRRWGVHERHITVSGIPIHPKWARPLDRRKILRDWRLPADRKIVLLAGGTEFTCGPVVRIARHIAEVCPQAYVVVLAGRSKKLLAELAASPLAPGRLVGVGFTDRVHELVEACSLMVTKPGGVTTAECLAKGTPMVLMNPVAGQEGGNAEYLAGARRRRHRARQRAHRPYRPPPAGRVRRAGTPGRQRPPTAPPGNANRRRCHSESPTTGCPRGRHMSHFDDSAASWDDNPDRVGLMKAVGEAIVREAALTGDMRVLDYGCGTGLVSLYLLPYVGGVTGADNSPGMLEVLKNKIAEGGLANMRTVRLDLEKDTPPADRYHLIVVSMALHHIADVDRTLRAFHQMLLPGGTLCIADLDSEGGAVPFRPGRRVGASQRLRPRRSAQAAGSHRLRPDARRHRRHVRQARTGRRRGDLFDLPGDRQAPLTIPQ